MEIKKILHCADLHLGSKNIKLSSEKQKALLQEHLNLLENVFRQDDYDLILICGDLFHNKTVSRKVINTFFKCVESFAKPVLYICGNHDENFEFISYPPNFIILDNKNPVYRTDNIDIWFPQVEYKNFDESKINVLMAHGEISNKKDNDYLDLSSFMSKKFNYVAMGHEHTFSVQKILGTSVVYSGALFANGFDECGSKGVVNLQINESNLDFTFVPIRQTEFQILDFNITAFSSFEELKKSFNEFLNKQNYNNIVKLRLNGYYFENERPNIAQLKSMLDRFFYAELFDNTKLKLDFEKFKSELLSFKAEFINLVESSSLNEDEKNLILTIGLESLQGDDLSI